MKILVLSDIHGNKVALEAVLADAGSVDDIWNLGDVVGYGPEPGWCVDRIVALRGSVSLSGNHDLAAIGLINIRDFNYVARAATIWTSAQLDQDQRSYLESLSSQAKAHGMTFAHGSPRAPVWEYIDDAYTAELNFDILATDTCFVGHTHVAAISECPRDRSPAIHTRWNPGQRIALANRRLILNPGSVGQPRDGDSRASYAIYDPDDGVVTLHRTQYDIASVQAQMYELGLTPQLADRLARGQ